MAAEQGLKSSLENLKPFESSGLSSDKATLLKPVKTGCLDLFSKALICTLTLDVLNLISAPKELARQRVQYKSTRNCTHFPQRGLNLKSCVLPISLQEPLKHL